MLFPYRMLELWGLNKRPLAASWEELGGREQAPAAGAREGAGEVLGKFRIIAKAGYSILRVAILGTDKEYY